MALVGFALAVWEVLEASSLAEIGFDSALAVDAAATAVVASIAGRGGDGLVRAPNLKKSGRNLQDAGTPSAPPQESGDAAMDVDHHYVYESPFCTPDTIMGGVPEKRPTTPIETPKPKRVYEEVDNKHEREVKFTGPSYTAGWCRDFSGVQRTRINPVTGRIIGYKGIPRKRTLSPTSKYSEFWRQQKHMKTSFHAARSPGVWDSARR